MAAAQRGIARALHATVTGSWPQAPAYVREHIATHAAAGGCLDELLGDVDYLLAAEPARLLRALPSSTTPAVAGVRRVYRHAAVNLRTSERAERAAYLELAARQAGDGALADSFAAREPERPWATPWAAWRPASEHYVLGSHDGSVLAVAVGELEGRPITVSVGGGDGTLRVWDLDNGRQHGDALTGHNSPVRAVAVGELDGRPIAVSGGDDETLRVWDLHSGRQHGKALTGHDNWVTAVAVGELDGRPIAVSASYDRTLRVWNLHSERQHGKALTGHDNWVTAVAVGELDSRPIAVSASYDETLRVWDLRSGQQQGETLTGHDSPVTAVAVGELDGRPIAVSGGHDGTLRVWDLDSGGQAHAIVVGTSIYALAVDGSGGVIVGATPGVLHLIPRNL